MEINNYFNKFNTNFSKTDKGSAKMYTYDEKMNILVQKTKEVLADNAEKQVPENGLFRKVFVSFDVPDSDNTAMIGVEYDEDEPKTQRRLFVGVHHTNSDRLTRNYLLKGTKEEILAFLKDTSNQEDIIKTVNHLSQKTNEYYSSL